MQCALCGGTDPRPVYSGPIRAGSWGKVTDRPWSVLECGECGVQFLDPFPVDASFYVSSDYRQSYNDTVDPADFLREYDSAQPQRLELIGAGNLRGRVVGDFGAGGGAFLDAAHGLAKTTVAVEPFAGYHASLRERGHSVCASGEEVPPHSLDVATSFAVIEHVENPIAFLRDMQRALKPGGVAYIATPNRREILMQLAPDRYAPFWYRTAHLWYFDARSLVRAAETAGFTDVRVGFYHQYDLSNALCWLRDGRPTGRGKIDLFDRRLDQQWAAFLEANGLADNLWLVAHKG